MEPLAYRMRPQTIDDIVGQDHLVGPNGPIRQMVKNKKIPSLILYGNPGIGKTTLANCIVNELNIAHFKFNASTDSKQQLKDIIEHSNYYEIIIIVDEIHRMKKDIQDYLLPFVEEGRVKIIGLTTVNPYHSVNPAIRSRTLIYKLYDINIDAIKKVLHKAHQNYYSEYIISNEVFNFLAQMANQDVRQALNMFEALIITSPTNEINLEDAKTIIQSPTISYDKDSDLYYDILSALQKSIRGSDVDASLHYLAILLSTEDLLPLIRRLWVIAYEDIGLANPQIGPRALAAGEIALKLGLPEARIPLGTLVVEMALSPKSNSAYLAIDKALKDVNEGKGGRIPLHLKNTYSFDPRQQAYKYPHDYPGAWVYQQYLPDDLKDAKYYKPKESSQFEKALMARYQAIEEAKKKQTF